MAAPTTTGYVNSKGLRSDIHQQHGVLGGISKLPNADNNAAADLSTFRDVDLLQVLNRRKAQ